MGAPKWPPSPNARAAPAKPWRPSMSASVDNPTGRVPHCAPLVTRALGGSTMGHDHEHVLLATLKRQLVDRQIDRREFLRYATFLGMAAPAAYAFAGRIAGQPLVAPAAAQNLPRGGTLRLGMRCQDLRSPHTYSWVESANTARQVVDYLTVTGVDNITRPGLVEKWEASPDLKTWTLKLRRTVNWHNGRQFNADDVVWNLKRVLDPKTGSSTVGLMKGCLLEEFETGDKDEKGNPKKSTRLWDANAIQKVDAFTLRLNAKTPQLAIPEQLFHYPLLILDPAENGEFKVGSNGTGAFTLVESEVGRKQVLKARKEGYWGGGPYLDQIEFIDLGDDPAATVSALASKQVDGLYGADIVQLESLQKIPHVQMYQVATAYTATARMQPVKPFDDKRVRQAMRYAIDSNAVLQIAHRGLGQPGEHHHVSSVHPEYAKLAPLSRDVASRRETMARLEASLQDDAPIVQPVWRSIFTFHDKRVQGFRPHPTLYIFGHQLAIQA